MYGTVHRTLTGPAAGARDALVRDAGPAPVAVAIHAPDPMIRQGAAACLGVRPEVRVLAEDRAAQADVVLILTDAVTDETFAVMEAIAAARAELGGARFVLVGDDVRRQHVLRAVGCGMVSVIPRGEATFARIVRAVLDVRDGRPQLPAAAVGWLADRLRVIQRDVLEPHGLTGAGLETREVDVLRLLAQGLGTPEIATRLSYSERTVKNIIHGVLTRLRLRNRTQAVAYAMRSGAL
jgi:DNA-binding NarL/FixJ family response regulator